MINYNIKMENGPFVFTFSKSESKSYDLLRTEIYIEHKIFYQLKHDQD